jgi:hypothetical protein
MVVIEKLSRLLIQSVSDEGIVYDIGSICQLGKCFFLYQ